MLDVQKIKKDFPIFTHHPDLVYLDSASTSLKPKVMIDKLVEYYSEYGANVKRGIYGLSERATEAYENSREKVASFIGAGASEIIFTRNTTESLNLIAYALGRKIIEEGDEIVTTIMEHHSNFVPWQVLAGEVGAVFKVIDIDEEGGLHIKRQTSNNQQINLEDIVTKRTKILALTYVSNVLGTINPIAEIAQAAKTINPHIIIVVDAAQAIGHFPVNVTELDADFVAFSGHKMLGPSGVGVLWGKKELLNEMFPFLYGGEMIREVKIEETIFADPPEKFEAGTPAIADVIALFNAIQYLENITPAAIHEHVKNVTRYAYNLLESEFKELTLYGPHTPRRAGVISFTMRGLHPHDIAELVDEEGIAIRAGHHCAMPLHKRLGIAASSRASFHLYNSKEDVDKLIKALHKAVKTLRK